MKNSKHKRLVLKSAGILLGIGSLGLGANSIYAGCINAPDCAALGYTQTSCPDGGVKCPWNTSKMFCKKGEAACNNSYTTSMCTNSCSSPSGTPCLKNGTAYYPGCTTSRCGSSQTCSSGSCVCKAEYIYTPDICRKYGADDVAGESCEGKYTSCSCRQYGTVWNSSTRKCGCSPEYTQSCNRPYEAPGNSRCPTEPLYQTCFCQNGAPWNKENGCTFNPYTFACCDGRCALYESVCIHGEGCEQLGICSDRRGQPQQRGCRSDGATVYQCMPL